jgi:probable O-glycosylation ligase (exosortase A-associated)
VSRKDPDVLLEQRRFGEVVPDSRWRFHDVPQVVFSHRTAALLLVCVLALVSAWLAINHPPRLALALFLGMVGGVAVLFEPFFGVLAYAMLAFLRPQDVFWGLAGARLTMLVSSFTLVATAIQFVAKPDLRFLWRRQNLFVGLLWLFLWLSTMYGDFGVRQDKWMDYWNKLFLIYFISLAVVNSESKLYVLAWVLMLSIGYLAWWANERYFLDGWRVVHGPGKRGSAFFDENDFAMVLVMSVPFLWYIMRTTTHRLVRLGLLGMLPLAAHAVMVTFSRGGFLGLSASMLVVALRERNRKLGGALIAAGVVFFLVFAGDEYRNRIGSIDEYEEDKSASGRIEAWEVGGRMMARNPFFGVGLKQFVEAFPYYGNYEPREAHNSWVQLGSECGLIALGSYGMLVLFTLMAIRNVRKRVPLLPEGRNRELADMLSRIYEATLVGYLVCGFFLSMEDFEFFYLLVAMAQILDRITAKRLEDATRERLLERAERARGETQSEPRPEPTPA